MEIDNRKWKEFVQRKTVNPPSEVTLFKTQGYEPKASVTLKSPLFYCIWLEKGYLDDVEVCVSEARHLAFMSRIGIWFDGNTPCIVALTSADILRNTYTGNVHAAISGDSLQLLLLNF